MRKLLAIKVLFLAVLCWPAHGIGQTMVSSDLGLTTLKEKITTQIERIKANRELAESQILLAKTRIDEQIQRSEEQLALQLETLASLKELLNSQSSEAEASVKRIAGELVTFSGSALKDIEDQIAQTNQMLDKIRGLREEICNGCSSPTTSVTSPGTTVLASATPLTAIAPTALLPDSESMAPIAPSPVTGST